MGWFSKILGRDDDGRGAPPPAGTPEPRPDQTVGASGTPIYGGFILSSEKNSALAGTTRYRTFDEDTLNVPIVGAAVRFFVTLATKAGWKVAPAPDVAGAEQVAERFDKVMHDMSSPWHAVVRRAVMFKFRGFTVMEWTAKMLLDGTVGFLDVEQRPQYTIERWDVDRTGTVRGVWQRDPQTGAEIYLPRSKIVYLVDDTLTDSPDGIGLMRHVSESCRRLRRYEQLEGIGYETDLAGVPIGRIPLRELDEDVMQKRPGAFERREQAKSTMTTFARNHVRGVQSALVLDSETFRDREGHPTNVPKYGIEVIKQAGQPHQHVKEAIERINREVARVLGGEHLLLGADGKGSLALARVKTEMLALAVDSTLAQLAATFQSDLVRPWAAMNGIPEEQIPTLRPDSTQFRDVEQIAAVFRDMAAAGSTLAPDDPAISEIRELMGLSPPSESTLALPSTREEFERQFPEDVNEDVPETDEDEED